MKYSAALCRQSDGETSMNDFDNEILPTDPDEGEEITERVAAKIGAIAELYADYFVGDLDIDELVEGAAHGFVAYTGDKYGAYHNAEDFEPCSRAIRASLPVSASASSTTPITA